jgi:eukaryotic-like serine/threonine-protein kinase
MSQTMWVAGDEEVVAERHGFLERGDQLGRYLILSRLGTGGMGVVYAAYDPNLDRKVAIKLLRRGSSDPARRKAAQRRLMQEARAMARLAHPNVIAVHDVAEIDGRAFVAMEYVDGRTLDEVLEAESRDWRELLEILLDAGRGLAAAHAAGVIHRDFKPENVMLDRAGRVRVMDFGLASGIDAQGSGSGQFVGMSPEDIELAAHSSTGVHRPGASATLSSLNAAKIVGTPAYMAPEQHDGGATDARTDQFSFCVTLFEAIHGVRPFSGDTPAEVAAVIKAGEIRTPPEGSRVPGWIHAVILRGLSVRPEDRYPSMRALLAALRADPAIRRRRWMARGALALLAVPAVFGMREAFLAWTADPCAGASARIEKVWGEQRREGVRGAFEAVDKPYAADAWHSVSNSLDRYAESWLGMHRDACEANKVRGEQSDALLDLRMQCLSRRLAELSALVQLLGEADEALVRTSVEASYALVPVDVCADVDALRAPVPPPDAADARNVLDEVRQQLAQIKALEDAGRLTEGLALAPSAVQQARALEHAPLLAEALLQYGRLAWTVADAETSETALREAIASAATGKHHEVEARAWVTLVVVVGYGQAKAEIGDEIANAAMAAVSRAGDSVELRADLANARGAVALQRNQLEQAEDLFRETLLLERSRLGDDHPKTANARNNLALVMMFTKRYEDARNELRAAIEVYERTYGETHPKLARMRLNLASVSAALGSHGEAQTQAQRALEVSLREFGPDHVETGLVSLILAELDLRHRRFEEAKVRATNALRILEPKLGDHPHLAAGQRLLGAALRELGEHAEAVERLERAAAMAERTLDASDPTLAEIRVDLAEAYVANGRDVDAIPLLERGLSELPDNADRGRGGRVRFALARALWADEASQPRALTLAREAREELSDPSPGAGLVPTVEEVDAWLAGR